MSASPMPSAEPHELPIFPLNAVLFPEGVLPLRVFEARYMDMVRDCLRDEREFGVCLIRKGREVGAAAEPETVGCRARITDWNMEQLGVLQITAVGTRRFRIGSLRTESNGLLRALTEEFDEERRAAVAPKFLPCTELLERIIARIQEESPDGEPARRPILPPYQLGDATWVSSRLCEILPISLIAKQKLMELSDGATRLSIVHQYLQQQKII